MVGEGLLGEDGEGDGVGRGGIVAEAEVEAGLGWAGSERVVPTKPSVTVVGVVKLGVGGDGVYEVEAGARDGAGQGGVRGQWRSFEGGEANRG